MPIGLSVAIETIPGPIAGQTFRNISVPNFRPALYALAIRAPAPPFAIIAAYTFPISPSSLRKEYVAMNTVFDVAGNPAQRGVQREVDQYGAAPLIWTISGTTGWQRHLTDGFTQTGISSAIALQNLLWQFAELNQVQAQNAIPNLYHLELYDFFTGEFWEVVPIGPQGIYQDARRPIIMNYSFRLAGIRDLSQPPTGGPIDPIAAAFSVSPGVAQATLSAQIGVMISAYASATIKVL